MEEDKDLNLSVDDMMMRKRLTEISEALKRLEKKCHNYLDIYVKTDDWRIFKDGFLHLNHYFRPEDLVEIRTCNLGEPAISSLIPETQKILMCSNKIANQSQFNTHMTYNLTLLYDFTRAKINLTDCKQLACLHVRATHLSKVCKAGDKECFKKNIKPNVYENELCKGKFEETFEPAYQVCIRDISPINTMKFTGNL